jgi:hypothetical protein
VGEYLRTIREIGRPTQTMCVTIAITERAIVCAEWNFESGITIQYITT